MIEEAIIQPLCRRLTIRDRPCAMTQRVAPADFISVHIPPPWLAHGTAVRFAGGALREPRLDNW
jgi:hypothetical protein